MALEAFLSQLDALVEEAQQAFTSAGSADVLEQARIAMLGAKSGRLKEVQKELGKVPPADKPAAGKRFNEVKGAIEAAFQAAVERLSHAAGPTPEELQFDPTLPGIRPALGHLHPITQGIEELKDLFGRLGFTPVEGPEIEDRWHNFEALNIPLDHPARDPLDNFYLATAGALTEADLGENVRLLRSQTSTVQIRVMERQKPPVRIISVGRVYRPDDADDTHYPMFQQVEGLWVERGVTMADLKSVLRLFASAFLGGDVHIRFRPSFFPFTEPSVEVDMSKPDGGWLEMGGAGMVDPAVLAAVGYDPEEVTGFAFGLGVERIAARRHQIGNIRLFYENDVRFLHQF